MAETQTVTGSNQDFIAECEEEFAHRYSEKDKDFMAIYSAEPRKPPIVDPWYNKPRRPASEWNRQNQNRRNHNWDRRHHDRSERIERYAGKHHMYHRNTKPY
ncbi:RNMT-activating mini protein [Orussus abietinus]|uniref:RNMT-activating mini protein n=1 Tax=Orussus abietinus TaxID=222816 RepID=UPI0006258B55|nr:RNMT-activating mini protein [Orussus abietinus]XP_012279424.1 RNMT-activating mini protein [Orussus abietinus]